MARHHSRICWLVDHVQAMWKELIGDRHSARADALNSATGGREDVGISFPEFEVWWKKREGIDDPDIPVVPEYMTNKIAEMTNHLQQQVQNVSDCSCWYHVSSSSIFLRLKNSLPHGWSYFRSHADCDDGTRPRRVGR